MGAAPVSHGGDAVAGCCKGIGPRNVHAQHVTQIVKYGRVW